MDGATREMTLEEVVRELRKGQPHHRAVREFDEMAAGYKPCPNCARLETDRDAFSAAMVEEEMLKRKAEAERDALKARVEELEGALKEIAESKHCSYPEGDWTNYGIGVADGHRCAANAARAALAKKPEGGEG